MPPDVRQQCLHTQVHYLPRPFEATYRLGNSSNGLRVVDPEAEARFKKGSEPPGTAFNDQMAQVYPLVWTCPATKFQALMPQPRCLRPASRQKLIRNPSFLVLLSRDS